MRAALGAYTLDSIDSARATPFLVRLVLVAFAVSGGACRDRERERAPAAPAASTPAAVPAAPASTWYRLEIQEPPYRIPFFLEIPPRGAGELTAVIANGDERIRAAARWRGDQLTVDFPDFGTALSLDARGDELVGTWQADGFLASNFPVSGRRVAGPDPAARYAGEAPRADVAGLWELDVSEYGLGKARFSQRADGVVAGTVIASEFGDARFLSGRVVGDRLMLSTFDGMRAFTVEARITPDQKLVDGVWHYPGWHHLTFTGQRGRDVPLVDLRRARMRAGKRRVTVAELDDPGLAGKAILLDYFGTWCAGCQDTTPMLVRLHHAHHAKGLAIVSIALEPSDRAEAGTMIEAFRRRHDVPYPIAVHAIEDGDLMAHLPPELEGVAGFPVLLFLDRDRTVRAVHTGAISLAAGADHATLVAEVERLVAEILASPAPSPR